MPNNDNRSPDAGLRSGGALLVDCLVAAGTPLMTCVPGESFLPVLDAMYARRRAGLERPRLVTARHEAAAANMAEAAGKLTGRAATCFVTRGPGATHASIGLHTAYQDGTPLILVVGQVQRSHLGRQAFQEMDYTQVFGCSAKSVVQVMDASRIPEHVARAVQIAHTGRPGPVVLVLPEDVLAETISATPVPAPEPASPAAVESDLAALHHALDRADRPLLVVGGPGWNDEVGRQVATFAERAAIPIVSAFRWQSAVDNRSLAYAGYLGLGCAPALRAQVKRADLLVALGPRLDDPTTDGFDLVDSRDPATLVLVSQDPEELTRTTIAGLGILAGLTAVAADLAKRAAQPSAERAAWLAELRDGHLTFRAGPTDQPEPDLAAMIRVVRDALPDDAIITNGAGNYTVWVQRFFEFRRFGTQLAPRNGAMGYGLPAGLAAAALHPDRAVVAFAGDGCLLMSGHELATAVLHRLKLVVIVVNNAMFATIRMHQERMYPGHVIATDLHNPDFVAYAESFGVPAWLVTRTDQFPAAFAAASAHDGPSLIEIRTDPQQLTPDLRLDGAR